MSQDNNHDEWLSLIEISGPFLAVPVLKKAFPQGLEAVDGRVRKYLRQAYDEWCEARDNDDPQLEELHRAWIREVLARGLEYDEKDSGALLKRGEAIPATLHVALPEHGVTLSPDYALVNGQKALLLIQTYPANTDLDAAISQQGWVATPAERMVQLCRTTGCRLGLITNGERWLMIDAPVGSVVTYASWYARLWGQEPLTLQAFLTLLGIRRFFVDTSEQLPALFDESLQHQEEVTDALGEQVRRAVEVLIQSLDKEDLNSARTLLQDVAPTQLYEAGLTIMMRLVFLLSAEERGLLLMGDEAYEANYAISTLRMQLRKESDEVLERRHDAWARLLATFRAVYGGIEHETLRLPALGGSLFDPDRFPFLEGRPAGSSWRTDDARPLPIDNRTVLLLLEAIQQYQGRTLSYRALDVEQIGYVYEGLLERTVKRTDVVTVELVGGKGAKKTIHALSELEALRGSDEDEFTRHLASSDALKRSESAIRKDLVRVVDAALTNHLLTVCHGDEALRDRLLPIANLLRTDPWGYPLVYAKSAFIVTTGSDRRETGTHYTPKSLTEAIVAETLTPVVYVGPAEGAQREQWALKPPAELLDLKICDPAMGSGAFLVQACRWLSDRLVESWSQVETLGKTVSDDGEVLDAGDARELLPRDSEARTVIARRLIAERCLYGVDLNPLAVELAKLSIWLVTLSKGRPFGFLDHNLRCGDSLLGIHRLDQLTELSMTPDGKRQQGLFGRSIGKAVQEAIELRQQLRKTSIRDIHDVERMANLNCHAQVRLELPEQIADALISEVFRNSGNTRNLIQVMLKLADKADQFVEGDKSAIDTLRKESMEGLAIELPVSRESRRPLHWPLAFPEVFEQGGGFHAIVGNPPFLGGWRITGALGTIYRNFLVETIAEGKKGNADLSAYFFLRAAQLLNVNGMAGLLATNTISQGGTRQVGLDQLAAKGYVFPKANSSQPWPGAAALEIAHVWIRKGGWKGKYVLNNEPVSGINPYLTVPGNTQGKPLKLSENAGKSYVGSVVIGMGFILTQEQAETLINKAPSNADCLFPYLNGDDINSRVDHSPSRWVINFQNWPLNRSLDGSWDSASEVERISWLKTGVVPHNYPGPVAADYPDLLSIVEEKVRPERAKLKRATYRDKWWCFAERQVALYQAISGLNRFFVHPFTSKHHSLVAYEPGIVFSHMTVVLLSESWGFYAVVQSELHWKWALQYGNKLENRPQYSPSDCFETFPIPVNFEALSVIGERYYSVRQGVMARLKEGLTKIYNRIHNPNEDEPGILELRKLALELDKAVLNAYGWGELELEHGFHETSQGIRYTISEAARIEVLDRLLELNHARYEKDAVRLGQTSAKTQGGAKRRKNDKGNASSVILGDLFAGENA